MSLDSISTHLDHYCLKKNNNEELTLLFTSSLLLSKDGYSCLIAATHLITHHMTIARLISITPNIEEQIVFCGRVSNLKGQEEAKNPDRLIRYLIKHKHWSPFEMGHIVVEINTTRDISAQILRHRSFSFQEFSTRYSSSEDLGQAMVPLLRLQDLTNRQSSLDAPQHQWEELKVFESEIGDLFDQIYDLYDRMLDYGVAKESARKILPLNAPTRLYMAGNVRSWIHYLQIRSGPETQREHRVIALAISNLLKEHIPNIYAALEPCTASPSPSPKPERSSPLARLGRSITAKLSGYFESTGRQLRQFQELMSPGSATR
jgi:thymidylate synthase (FAD)